MALLNDYLEKDLHLFDLKTLLEDVDRFSELTSPFVVTIKIILLLFNKSKKKYL